MSEYKLFFSDKTGIRTPKKAEAYAILTSDWAYLKQKIMHIKSIGSIFPMITSVLLSVAAASFFAALTLSKPMIVTLIGDFRISLLGTISLSTLIAGLVAVYFALEQRKIIRYTRNDVLRDMERIENRYRNGEERGNDI